jgi:hypothetical protein
MKIVLKCNIKGYCFKTTYIGFYVFLIDLLNDYTLFWLTIGQYFEEYFGSCNHFFIHLTSSYMFLTIATLVKYLFILTKQCSAKYQGLFWNKWAKLIVLKNYGCVWTTLY